MNGFDRLRRQSSLPVIWVRERRCPDRHCHSNERGRDKRGFNRLRRQLSLPVIWVRERRCQDRRCHSNERGNALLMLSFLFLAAVALIAVAVLIVSTVSAHGSDAPRSKRRARELARPGEATRGTLLFRTESEPAHHETPLLKTDVRMTISGMVARVAVRQEFRNPASEWAEGLYVFPLPETAAVDHLHMEIGERIIEGVIQERGEATQRYEQAKSEGKRAGLVEQERPNMFTTSVANIGPGETIVVTIQYQETVRYDQGSFRLRFPMVVGPRYIPGSPLPQRAGGETGWSQDTDQVPDASRITPPVRHPSHGAINPFSLLVDLAPGFRPAQIDSPYHAIAVQQGPGGRYTIRLQDATVPADRDFELVWRPAAGEGPTAAMSPKRKTASSLR